MIHHHLKLKKTIRVREPSRPSEVVKCLQFGLHNPLNIYRKIVLDCGDIQVLIYKKKNPQKVLLVLIMSKCSRQIQNCHTLV